MEKKHILFILLIIFTLSSCGNVTDMNRMSDGFEDQTELKSEGEEYNDPNCLDDDISDNVNSNFEEESVEDAKKQNGDNLIGFELDEVIKLFDMNMGEICELYDITIYKPMETRWCYAVSSEYYYLYVERTKAEVFFVDSNLDCHPAYIRVNNENIYDELGLNSWMNFKEIDERMLNNGFAPIESVRKGIKYYQIYTRDNIAYIFESIAEDGYPYKLYLSSETSKKNEYNPDKVTTKTDKAFSQFINNEITAEYRENDEISYYNYFELKDSEDIWAEYNASDTVDIDNDGQYELILSGPYGGMYLDASNGRINVIDKGGGTGDILWYTYYDGKIWVVHTYFGENCEYYRFYLYNANGEIDDTFLLSHEDGSGCYYRNQEISLDEYEKIRSEFFLH